MNAELLVTKGLDALQYIKNPYALVGFMFLIGTVAISFFKMQPRTKAGLLVVFASLVVVFAYRSLDTTLAKTQDELLVQIVRDQVEVPVVKGVDIQLVDIESLKGAGHWTFNENLPDIQHILDVVLTHASVKQIDKSDMNEAKWTELLESLEKSENIKAEIIKDTGFAKFRVFVDGVEDEYFKNKFFFKNEFLCIPKGLPGCTRAKLKIVNLYNTVHHSSGEPEAANLRVIRE